MKALGMVETKGLVCVVEALDSMLKTADVQFAGQKRVGSESSSVYGLGSLNIICNTSRNHISNEKF